MRRHPLRQLVYYQLLVDTANDDIPGAAQVAFPGIKAPANASVRRVNLRGYLFPGRRALFGLVRAAPGASVGIGEKQKPILIATAGRAIDGLAAFGGGDQFIQPEETHQEDSHGRNGNQEGFPAGLQNGVLHDELQETVQLLVKLLQSIGISPKIRKDT